MPLARVGKDRASGRDAARLTRAAVGVRHAPPGGGTSGAGGRCRGRIRHTPKIKVLDMISTHATLAPGGTPLGLVRNDGSDVTQGSGGTVERPSKPVMALAGMVLEAVTKHREEKNVMCDQAVVPKAHWPDELGDTKLILNGGWEVTVHCSPLLEPGSMCIFRSADVKPRPTLHTLDFMAMPWKF